MRGRLVEEDQAGIAQIDAGKRDALDLAAGEADAVFADKAREPVGQLVSEVR